MIDSELAKAVAAINRELVRLQKQVRLVQQSQTKSQLGQSSIDDGYLTVVSGGTVRQIIGIQPDGTVTTVDQNGPAPPVPSAPTVTPASGGLTVAWDGTFSGGAPQPLDFTDVEVHISTIPGFTPGPFTLHGTLLKPGQITLQPLASVTYYVGLVAANTSGNKSVISTEISGVPQTPLVSPVRASDIGYIGVLNANPYFTGGDGTGWTSGGGTPGAAIVVSSPVGDPPPVAVQQQVSDTVGGSAASSIVGTPLQPPATSPPITPTVVPLAGAGFLGTPGTVSVVNTQPAGSPYAYALQLVSNTSGGGTAYEPGPPAFPAVPGQQYLVTGLFYTPGTSVSLGLSFLLNGTWITDVVQVTPVSSNTWTQVAAVVTAPSGVNSAGPVFSTPGQFSQYTMYGQAVTALPQVPGALIQAGTVTAIQIATGTIVAGIIDGTTVEAATLIVDASSSGSGEFIYNGDSPALGNLIGSWTAVPGTDAFGNSYPAGLYTSQAQFTGIGITNADIEQSEINASNIDNSTINNPAVLGGTIQETDIVFDTIGGSLLIYAKTTTTVTLTGEGTWTAPAGSAGTAKIQCWGAGGGGGNDASAAGGGGGGGGEYACEPTYPITDGQVYTYNTGAAGGGTTNGKGGQGNDTWFDSRAVYAHGGQGGGTSSIGFWVGGNGGTGSTNAVHFDGGQGGNGFGPSGGGGGGGSSAGTGATGASGNDGAHSGGTGGTGGSAPSGGGSGGNGGNNTAAGSAASAPGGGGGGSGTNGGSSSRTDTFHPTATYSYYGADNTQGFPRTLSNTNGNMQQGCANNPSLGTFFSFAHFNSSAIMSALSGRTIDAVSIGVDCLHSWYNSGMTIYLDYSGVSSFPSPISIPSSTHIGSYGIGEGQSATLSVPNSVGAAFQSGAAQSLYFHAPNQSLGYYGYLQGGTGNAAPHLNIASHTGTSIVPSGTGSDGQLKITYVSGVTLIASFSGTAFTDVYGNSIPVGVMINTINAIHPASGSAVVETWQTPSLGSGWATGSNISGFQGVRYRLLPTNEVEVSGLLHSTSSSPAGTLWTMPAQYCPSTKQRINCLVNKGGGTIATDLVDIDVTGTVILGIPVSASGNDVQFGFTYPLS